MINLIYDNFKDGNPLPNGLSPKYFDDWKEECLYRNDYNVLTRFIPTDRNKMGYFPLLLEKSRREVHIKTVDQATPGETNWLVIEPNMLDRSLILENCFGCLSEEACKSIQEGRVKLVIYYAYEAFPLQQCHWMELVERSLGMLNIPAENVIFVFGDRNLEQNFEQYLRFNNPWFGFVIKNRHEFSHFEFEFQEYIQHIQKNKEEAGRQLVEPNEETLNMKREKQYLCLNGGGREHRVFLLGELNRLDLLKHGHVSYLAKFKIPVQLQDFLWKKDPMYKVKAKFHKDWEQRIEPIYLDLREDFSEWHNRGMHRWCYEQSYFSLVTETYPAPPSFFVTEKIFKPIVNMHPFLLMGAQGTLSYLKELGYETFPEMFNESYDGVEHQGERLSRVVDALRHHCDKGIDYTASLYKEVWPKLVHNRNHFLNRHFSERVDQLIDSMLSRHLDQ